MKKKSDKKKLANTEVPNLNSTSADFKQIHDLVKLVTDNNIGEISFEKGDYKLTIKQKSEGVVYTNPPQQMLNVAPPAPIAKNTNMPPPATPTEIKIEAPTDPNLITIKSPMIGTFYLRPSPDKPNFVEIGSEVKKGSILCLVEAMKLFNEIESDIDGKIVKILVNNSNPIEFDQPLFLIEPL